MVNQFSATQLTLLLQPLTVMLYATPPHAQQHTYSCGDYIVSTYIALHCVVLHCVLVRSERVKQKTLPDYYSKPTRMHAI